MGQEKTTWGLHGARAKTPSFSPALSNCYPYIYMSNNKFRDTKNSTITKIVIVVIGR